MDEFLRFATANNVTDLFLAAGKNAAFRIMNEVTPAEGEPLSAEQISAFRLKVLGERGEELYQTEGSADASYRLPGGERFRLNFFQTLSGPAAVARPIKNGDILDCGTLGIPQAITEKILRMKRGIVVIAGSTGSGKSTTMAALVNAFNQTSRKHILTLEDPIEFVHSDNQCFINQREIDAAGKGFHFALRAALRENPDIILVGEIRDTETMSTALSAAQTGHLVITTMHTSDAPLTVERLVHLFPENSRDQVAADFAMVLEAVIVQRLLPKMDQTGMVPALEVLFGTPGVRKQIASGDFVSLEESIRLGSEEQMNTFNQSLFRLFTEKQISFETACAYSDNPDELKMMASGVETRTAAATGTVVAAPNAAVAVPEIQTLLRTAVRHGASDLILSCGAPPTLRINGVCTPLELPVLNGENVRRLLFSILSKRQRVTLEEDRELDFSLSAEVKNKDGNGSTPRRFRVNAFFQRGNYAMVARVVPAQIPQPGELGLPPVLLDMIRKKQGLILITGPTGSGKSTTLASLLDLVNHTSQTHIITIEDPVEYVYQNDLALIEQRELGFDTKSFANALRAALREAPDIIMVGEMRDTETISAALTAAETGHLVLGTIHTNGVIQTVDRIIDSFSESQQNQIRQQFAASLLAVVSQRLLPRLNGHGRVGAFEVMIGTPPVQALIRESKTHLLQSTLETSTRDGMITMERALQDLCDEKKISQESLMQYLITNPRQK